MRAVNLQELRSLVESAEFGVWWDEMSHARAAHEAAGARAEDLDGEAAMMMAKGELAERKGTERIAAASERESRASRLHAESLTMENVAFAGVERFEEHRKYATAAWHKKNAIEEALNEAVESKSGKVPSPAALAEAQEAYAQAEKKKDDVWNEVVAMWERSLELQLDSTEQAALAAREKHAAEHLFAEAEARRQRAARLRSDAGDAHQAREAAAAKIAELRKTAETTFGCASGDALLFFRHRARPTYSLVVSLVADERTFGIPVRPLGLYEAERLEGARALAPVSEPKVAGDAVHDFLRAGKPQQPAPAEPAGSGPATTSTR